MCFGVPLLVATCYVVVVGLFLFFLRDVRCLPCLVACSLFIARRLVCVVWLFIDCLVSVAAC